MAEEAAGATASAAAGGHPSAAASPRLLVVTDVHLDSKDPGAIYLRTLLEMYPRDRLAICHLTLGDASLPPSLDGAANVAIRRPREHGVQRLGRAVAGASRPASEWYLRRIGAPAVARRVVAFGREQRCEVALVVLNGPTTICTARPVAESLGVPLVTMVWDPIEYRLGDAWGLSPSLARPYVDRFGEAVRQSRRCAVMSDAMQHRFAERYGVETVILRLGVPRARWRDGEPRADDGEFVITFAGNLYAHVEWAALLAALDRVGWRLAGRDVRIRVLSGYFAAFASAPMRVEFLGWHSVASSEHVLAASDLAYLPYWLDERFAEPARLSFPSKLSAYVSAGCPVFFHGPSYASVTEFMGRYPFGAACHSNDPDEVGRALERCASDGRFRASALRAGRRALEEELGLAVFRRRFAALLDVAEGDLLPVED